MTAEIRFNSLSGQSTSASETIYRADCGARHSLNLYSVIDYKEAEIVVFMWHFIRYGDGDYGQVERPVLGRSSL